MMTPTKHLENQERQVSIFTQSKHERDIKIVKNGAVSGPDAAVRARGESSTIGNGMQVTGNIVCAGALTIAGRVTGDIHAAQLTVGEDGKVEGNIIAPEAIIRGMFKGTVRGNTVKLQGSAVVEGEIFNQALSIEEAARFEGVARRLDKAIEAPSSGANPTLRTIAPTPAIA